MSAHKTPLWRKWLYCLLPALAAILLYLLLPLFPQFTETVFTRILFRMVSYPLTWLLSLPPFSVTEAIVVLGMPTIIVLLVIFVYRICRRKNRWQIAERGARWLVWCLSIGSLVFMLMDGGNYYRLPIDELMGLRNDRYDTAFLAAVTTDLAQKCSTARLQVQEDADGYMMLSASPSQTLLQADDCYRSLREDYPFLKSGTWRVKSVALSHLWSYTGYTGVYCPWLGEISINTDTPPSEWGHTATHEIGHTMGFAREDACNFLAYLACIQSGQPDFVYSGYLAAYIYCSNALYNYDPDAYREAVSHCSDGVLRDLRQRSRYWKQFEGDVMDASQNFNDTFIKFNGVESGVLSYNEVVSLILQYYDTYGLLS